MDLSVFCSERCQVPGLAFIASSEEAIGELRVGLMERQQQPQLGQQEKGKGVSNGVQSIEVARAIFTRRLLGAGFPTSSLSSSSSLSSTPKHETRCNAGNCQNDAMDASQYTNVELEDAIEKLLKKR